MKDLKENESYLIQRKNSNCLNSITLIKKTEKAYFIRWHNYSNGDSLIWELINEFDRYYELIEIITDVQSDLNNEQVKEVIETLQALIK